MHVMPLSIYFDNCKRLTVTQGEERTLSITLYDEQLNQPVDLTGLQVLFSVPSTSGNSIKRSTSGLPVDLTQAKQGDGQTIFTGSHGFVTDDVVSIAADAENVTSPLAPGASYRVTVIDDRSFTLSEVVSGTDILLDAKTGKVTLTSDAMSFGTLILGKLSLTLTSAVTQQMAAMQGQDYQLTLRGNGMTRIYTGRGQLDVFAQAAP